MTQKQFSKDYIFTVFSWSMIIIFTAFYMSLIFSEDVWSDEAFTLQLLKNPIMDIINGTAEDVHPPLYYLYAKFFYDVFHASLIWQKIATILPMLFVLICGATIIRHEFDSVTSFLFILFMGCVPCSMELSLQVRMYSLALLFVTLCGVSAYQAYLYEKKRFFVLCGATGLAAAYTHYFAFVSVVFIYGFLLIAILAWKRDLILKWSLTGLGMILGYLPWIPSFLKQIAGVNSGFWLPKPTASAIWGCFRWAFDVHPIEGTVYVFLLILTVLGMTNIRRLIQKPEKKAIYALFCMMVPACTCISGLIASYIKTPIYRDKYVFPAFGLLALFFAINLAGFKKSFIIACTVFLCFVGSLQYKNSYDQEYRASLWPKTKEFFNENMEVNDYILYNYKEFGFIYECYFLQDKPMYFKDFDYQGDYGVLWFLDTDGMPELDETYAESYNLQAEYIERFGIENNEFDLYKITKKQILKP